jgi:hypothetical protein
LALATGLAYTSTLPKVRKLFGTYPHESMMSAWWMVFDAWPRPRTFTWAACWTMDPT